jgi:monothiol glutaredoxin
MDVLEKIDQIVKQNRTVLFMKGTPQFPMCGYSSRAAAALEAVGAEFAFVNVLQDPEIFESLPRYADWPTFPQLYVSGELVGGCDITLEMYENGQLKEMVGGSADAQVS